MIGEEPVDHPLKAVQFLQKKFGHKMAPVEVSADRAISSQNVVEGDKIDIRQFPAQRMWPLDGGSISAPMTPSSPKIRRLAASMSVPIV
jgi:3-polyprenyl-4-hydroxybenzoate decarboxylase